MTRVLLAGLGSIGRRHLANIPRVWPDADVTVWRHARSDEAVPPGAARVVYGADEALAVGPHVAIIATPACHHLAAARPLLAHGVPLYLEKPLSHDLAGVDAFVEETLARRVPVVVGYVLRFSPVVEAVKTAVASCAVGRLVSLRAEVGQYLPDWRPGQDYRAGVSARAALGGGALLELSHELDLVRWIGGEVARVGGRVARLGDLDLDVEDTVELVVEFSSGALASVHLDFLQRVPSRGIKVVGTEGVLTADLIAGEVRVWRDNGPWRVLPVRGDGDRNAMYVDALAHFARCAAGEVEPAVTVVDGRQALALVDAARRASRDGRMVNL